MSLTTLILGFLFVGLSLMVLGWLVDSLGAHPAPASPQLDVAGPHAARSRAGLAKLSDRGGWSSWDEN